MLALLAAGALAAPAVLDEADARLSGRLREAAARAEDGTLDVFRDAMREPPPIDGIAVSVEADDPDALVRALETAGIEVEAAAAGRVQAFVPYARLREVAGLSGVRRVREPWRATPKERVTEGYDAVLGTDWGAEGLAGAGVRVAIVDVGFARLDAVGDAEVPAERVTDFTRGRVDATEHGTAVTELVYDFAPEATFYLATISTEVDLAEVLAWLIEEDVDVVNASIGFDNVAHADGDSYVTRVVDAAVDAGLIYVAAAGNENDKYRVGALARGVGGGVTLAGAEATHAWSGGGYVQISLRWSEPFGEASTDLDLVVYNEDGTECGRSEEPQDGDDDPYEIVYGTDCSALVTAVIEAPEGVDPIGLEGYLYAPWSIEEADWTNTEDLTLPGDTRGGVSVGAWYTNDATLPSYSSRGPTNDGRAKPDVVAPTAVSTATYGRGGFEGSSAAAPHVAGLATLWVEATGRRGEPEMFRQWLRLGAEDVGAPGLDLETGAGLVRADVIPPSRCGCAAGTTPPAGALAALALLAARRRRCA